MARHRVRVLAAAAYTAAAGLAAWWVVPWVAGAWKGEYPIDPVALRIGPLQVRWYGLLMSLAFIPGWMLAQSERKRLGLSVDDLLDAVLLGIPLGLLGARLGFVVQHLGYYLRQPADILHVGMTGLSMHGVMAGAGITIWIVSRRKGVSAAGLADLAAPSVLLGQAIGRWGNFFNQELFGYPTSLPWGLYVQPSMRPIQWAEASTFHPVFFYESVYNALGVLALAAYRRRHARRPGEVAALYLAVYSAGRFLVEFVRVGERLWLHLTLAQWVSLLLIAVGLAWWWASRYREAGTMVQ